MKKSLKKRIALIFTSIMCIALVLIAVVHFFFIDDFYDLEKRHVMIEIYNYALSDDFDEAVFDTRCQANNISYMITDANMGIIKTNGRDVNRMSSSLFGAIMDYEADNTMVVSEKMNYQISRFYDERRHMNFIQLLGVTDNDSHIFMQTPLESIDLTATLSTIFFILVGIVTIVISVITIMIVTEKLTSQMEELTDISERMANLDFNARYTGGGEDEIGIMGKNFNKMSENLKSTMRDLKNANVKLSKDIKIINEKEEKRRDFLSSVSHELKTPIALIQGYAEGIKEMDMDKESQDAYLDVIIDESKKMNRLVMQLMSLEQIESGRDALDLECFNLNDVISGVLSSSSLMIEQAGATIVFDAEKEIPVWADEFKIEQVITNFLTNAIHHLEGDKIIKISSTVKNKTVVTTVFNTGKPIPKDSIDKIWNRFYKVDKARTRAYGGSGIGLSIVKAIMEAHNQSCYVTNYENGVAFSFTLEAR